MADQTNKDRDLSHWQKWAKAALDKMGPAKDDEDIEWKRARPALEHVLQTGYEPYFTLKAFVTLELEEHDSE